MFHHSLSTVKVLTLIFNIMWPTFPTFTFDNKMCAMVPAQKEIIQSPKCIPLPHPKILYAQIITKTRNIAAVAQKVILWVWHADLFCKKLSLILNTFSSN